MKRVRRAPPKVYPITNSIPNLAYIAGLIDGEGTVCIFNSTGKTKGIVYPRGRPILAITNTHRGVLDWVKSQVGGAAVYVKRARNDSGRYKPCYAWSTGWQHAKAILIACLPYLIIKREQALLFIEFCNTCKHYGKIGVPVGIAKRRQEIIDQMAILNR